MLEPLSSAETFARGHQLEDKFSYHNHSETGTSDDDYVLSGTSSSSSEVPGAGDK